jgi:hypothetical protein
MFCEFISRWTLPIVLFGCFVLSMAIFAGIYECIYLKGLKGIIEVGGRKIIGALPPEPTFYYSEAYQKRVVYEIQVDLRVRPFFGNVQPISWMSFDWVPRPQLTDPGEPTLDEIGLRGLTSKEMIEEKFKFYGSVKYKFGIVKDGSQMSWILNSQISALPSHLKEDQVLDESNAKAVALEIENYFKLRKNGYLGDIHNFASDLVEKYSKLTSRRDGLEKILYGSLLIGFSQGVWLSFEDVNPRLTYWDFFYFALTGSGEIMPVSRRARIVNSIQYFFVYCFLSFFVAVLIGRLPKF